MEVGKHWVSGVGDRVDTTYSYLTAPINNL
jgi:hypothetical protein